LRPSRRVTSRRTPPRRRTAKAPRVRASRGPRRDRAPGFARSQSATRFARKSRPAPAPSPGGYPIRVARRAGARGSLRRLPAINASLRAHPRQTNSRNARQQQPEGPIKPVVPSAYAGFSITLLVSFPVRLWRARAIWVTSCTILKSARYHSMLRFMMSAECTAGALSCKV